MIASDGTPYVESLQEQQKENEARSCTGLLTSYHGVAYQVQWLMIVALEAKNSKAVGFRFRTEVDYEDSGKFDDVVWQYYGNKEQKFKYNFLQAKHKLYEKTENIEIKDLLKEGKNDNPFGLTKYYISYKDGIKNNTKYENGIIDNLIIATNIDFDEDLKRILLPVNDVNSILHAIETEEEGLSPACWKIDYNLDEEYILKIVNNLEGTYDLIKLAQKLEDIIFNNQDYVLPSFMYKNVMNDQRTKISDNFIENPNLLDEITIFLRDAFFYEAFIKKRKLLCVNENCEGISDSREFAQFIAKKISDARSKNNTVRLIVTKKRKVNINKLSNFVLIKRKDGIKFNPKFWKQKEITDKSLKKFRKNIIIELKSCGIICTNDDNAKISAKLDVFKFDIANFTTCREHLVDEESFWKGVKDSCFSLENVEGTAKDFIKLPNYSINDIKEDIDEFLNILVFAVNYTKKHLNKVIEEQLKLVTSGFKKMKCITNEFTAYAFRSEIAKALDLTENKFISTAAEVSQFFDKVEIQTNRLILLGPTLEYCAKIDSYNINYHPTVLCDQLHAFINLQDSDVTKFENLLKKQVLCIKTDQKLLSSIKVFHALINTAKYNSTLSNYIFMGLESMLYLQDYVIQVFDDESNSVDLLVIECEVKDKQKGNVLDLCDKILQILHAKIKKRIVLISHGDNILTKKIKTELGNNYYETVDSEIGLSSLDNNSQLDILDKGKVFFQGSELSIGKLVGDSKELIDSQILYRLLNYEKFEICNTLPGKENIINFYIPRELICRNRVSTEIIKEQSNDLFAFSSTEEIELINIARQYNDATLLRKICKFKKINFKLNNQFKFIVLNESSESNQALKDFNTLCNYTYNNSNIHWLIKEADYFKWRQTKGVFTNLRPFLGEEKYYKEINIDDNSDDVKNEILDELRNDRIILIGAVPGMGKSVLIQNLVLELKKTYPQIWVVVITLRKFRSELKKIDLNDEDSAMAFFYEAIGFKVLQENKDKDLHKKVMKWFKQKEETKNLTQELKIKGVELLEVEIFNSKLHKCNEVYVFFDGFDEVCPAYENTVTYLIKVLKHRTSANIWITSRTYNIIDTLEDNLETISYSIKAFGEKEQRLFLIKYWKSRLHFNKFNEKRSKVFIDALLTEFSNVINDTKRTFVGVPLQIYMLAQNRLTMFQEFYESGDSELSNEYKRKMNKGLNLASLYDDFINIKFHEIRFKEKKHEWPSDDEDIEDMMKELHEKFLDEHQILALYTLYADIDKVFPGVKDRALHLFHTKYSNTKDKNAIIVRFINTTPLFVHQTYAEYFAALYLWKKFEMLELEEFYKNFLPFMLNGFFFSDDKIQVCKFFYFIADKNIKENINSIRLLNDKIILILKEILPIVESIYTSYESTGQGHCTGTDDLRQITYGRKKIFLKFNAIFKRNPLFVQVVKYIFFIIESYLEGRQSDNLEIISIFKNDKSINFLKMASETGCSNYVKKYIYFIIESYLERRQPDNLEIHSIFENDKSINFLKIASKTGCFNFVKKHINKKDNNYEKYLKFSKWYYNPLWLAARNGYLDVVKHLSLLINHNWVDKDNLTLTQRAYWLPDINVIRSCLSVNILDGNPYCDLNGSIVLPVVYAVERQWPIDVIQLLIEKTDVSVFNAFVVRSNLKASFVTSIALLKHELHAAQLMVQKGFNFSGVIQILLFEFTQASLYGPIDKIIYNMVISPSFHTEQEYLMLYDLIDMFLRSGVGYNSFPDVNKEKTIGLSTQICYIHKLFKFLCTHKIGKISPLKVLLKLIIDSVKESHKIIKYSGGLLLSNSSEETICSYGHKTVLKLVPSVCKKMSNYLEQYKSEHIISCIDSLKSYLEQANTEINDFKKYADRNTYNNVLIAYEEMLKFKYQNRMNDIHRIELYKSFLHNSDEQFNTEMLQWIFNLYLKQDFEIWNAFNEVTQNIRRYMELKKWIATKPKLSVISCTEIIENFDLQCDDSFESRSRELSIDIIKKIVRFDGLETLLDVFNKLSYIGEKCLIQVMREMSKYEQISTRIFNLLNELHES